MQATVRDGAKQRLTVPLHGAAGAAPGYRSHPFAMVVQQVPGRTDPTIERSVHGQSDHREIATRRGLTVDVIDGVWVKGVRSHATVLSERSSA